MTKPAIHLHIRPVCIDDAAATARILNDIIATQLLTAMEKPITVAEQAEYIRTFSKSGCFLVAEHIDTQAIVGLQSLEPLQGGDTATSHIGEISTFIDDAYRGHGVGTRLTHVLLDEAQKLGYQKIIAYIRADNTAAQAFYLQQGFRMVGRLAQHIRYRGGYLDQVLAERLLTDPGMAAT